MNRDVASLFRTRARSIAQTTLLSVVAWFGARALCEIAVPRPVAGVRAVTPRVRAPRAVPRLTDMPRKDALPACDDVVLGIVSVADKPADSRATLRVRGRRDPAPHRVGDHVGARKLVAIGFDGRHATPVAVLAGQGSACRVGLGAGPARPATRPATPPAASLVRGLLHGVHFVRARTGGLQLFGVRPGSGLSLVGIDNGDSIESVNGLSLVDPLQALQLYTRLPRERELRIRIRRAGSPLTLVIHIV